MKLELLKTGNWSEVPSLEEKNSVSFKTAGRKVKIKMISFLAVLIICFISVLVINVSSGRVSMVLLLGLVILGYSVYDYLIPEYGANFVVPNNKVQRIEFKGTTALFYFTDFNGLETSFRLMKLDANGIEIISNIKLKQE